MNAIKWTKGKNKKFATVIFGEGHQDRIGKIETSRGRGGLTMFMNFGPRATVDNHFRQGNPRFIEATEKETRKRFNKSFRRVISAFVR